ncbi:alpha-E domain-containing protein [Micrococcales bacterium 31B]|nr:alpha-E domain-containing protein [Micrococcales bacterium 31B]
MLSRIAEALLWMGRYVERADDTARILDVHMENLLEDHGSEEEQVCRNLMDVMGVPVEPGAEVNRGLLLHSLAFDRYSMGSIVGSLRAARENARGTREVISTELWECLNTTYNTLPREAVAEAETHGFFMWVRERSAIVSGLIESQTSRDDTWNFYVLGRALERVDMTARLLASSRLEGRHRVSWTTFLRSCGAHEAFTRAYRGVISDASAAEFLLLDRLFPRSIMFALLQAESVLQALDGVVDRVGLSDPARRALGLARASIEYRPLRAVLEDLPRSMREIQRSCNDASVAVQQKYFPREETPSWVKGGAA